MKSEEFKNQFECCIRLSRARQLALAFGKSLMKARPAVPAIRTILVG
jgi:hypothetical protein